METKTEKWPALALRQGLAKQLNVVHGGAEGPLVGGLLSGLDRGGPADRDRSLETAAQIHCGPAERWAARWVAQVMQVSEHQQLAPHHERIRRRGVNKL